MTAVILRRRGLGKATADGVCAAATKGLIPVRNWAVEDWPTRRMDYVFRWGCTSYIPYIPSERGTVTVVNTNKAIHWCSDKRNSRLEMQAAGVPVPRTFAGMNEFHASDMVGMLEQDWTLSGRKVVVRPSRHAQGRHLYVMDYPSPEAFNIPAEVLADCYVSELINKVAEYRVFVCQNRAVWVTKKTPGNPEQVAWNVAQGGRFDNVRWGDWPLPVIKAALAAAKVAAPLGLTFCGVDVMVDAEGKPYVLEVNSAPSQTSEYRQRCVAKAFDYIIEHGKQHFDDVPDGPRRTYKSYIHPAIRPQE